MITLVLIALWCVIGYGVAHLLDESTRFTDWFETASTTQRMAIVTACGPAIWWLCAKNSVEEI